MDKEYAQFPVNMTEEKIRVVVRQFAEEVGRLYGCKLCGIILYGSCARGDFKQDSDIDRFVLLDVPPEEINKGRIMDVSDRLDWEYDIVLSSVFQSCQLYEKYLAVSVFYQNIQKEGVKIA